MRSSFRVATFTLLSTTTDKREAGSQAMVESGRPSGRATCEHRTRAESRSPPWLSRGKGAREPHWHQDGARRRQEEQEEEELEKREMLPPLWPIGANRQQHRQRNQQQQSCSDVFMLGGMHDRHCMCADANEASARMLGAADTEAGHNSEASLTGR